MAKHKDQWDEHHRKPVEIGGENTLRNTSRVNVGKHRAWHQLFGTMTAQEIVAEINEKWLDPDFKVRVFPTFSEPAKNYFMEL